MKKFLLFAIVALSINTFAQNNKPQSNSTANVHHWMGHAGRTTSDAHATMNLGRAFQPKTPNQDSLVQIFDSVCDWEWDALHNVGWRIYEKEINYVYDAHHNRISYTEQRWNGSWGNYIKITCAYDSNNNCTSWLEQNWNDSTWENIILNIYTYDANNNQTSDLNQGWNGSAWENSYQYIFTYDGNKNQTRKLYQSWIDGVWLDYTQDICTYNANDKLTSLLVQGNWNDSGMVNQYLYIYTYDTNNNQTSELYQGWNDSTWVNWAQYIYTYDANNNVTSELIQTWNGSAWVNYEKDTLTYDTNNKKTYELDQYWTGNAWANQFQSTYTYTYNVNNNKTNEFYQKWNDTVWITSAQYITTYDANNFEKSYSEKAWNSTGTEVQSGDSTYYYFYTNLGINELKLQDAGITVYPNPTSGKFTVSSKSVINSLEIYNLQGQQVCYGANFNGRTTAEIDLSNQSKGTYILNVHSGAKVYSCKIVLQ